jgi:hypothetical protein
MVKLGYAVNIAMQAVISSKKSSTGNARPTCKQTRLGFDPNLENTFETTDYQLDTKSLVITPQVSGF